MLSSIRRHVSASGVIGLIALVFAFAGGAYAANKVLITKLNQISPKVQKQLKGNAGPAGPQGPKGDPGAPGTSGGPGPKGDTGDEGAEGPQGEQGDEGPPGSPWVVDGTLPEGATEKGAFALKEDAATVSAVGPVTAISFPIPLATELDADHVHMVSQEDVSSETVPAECEVEGVEGSPADPLADPGHLCVYVAFIEGLQANPDFEEGTIKGQRIEKLEPIPGADAEGASTSGARLRFSLLEAAPATNTEVSGTFAVTG